ncbi:T7SS effector LXG polymorphic toxin [Pseudogracilibacillus sp. SE30717A]|uniref:LXG domain-containing protein n=1 Tax=Pseudogracilibacillus sp. SE30717A TaxID=3098293 RepID=UPI00300DC23C
MKVLDVKSLSDSVQSIHKDIQTIQSQISAIQRAVRGITESEAELKGETGKAIRNFYQEVHQTFLIFLHQSLTDYFFILKGMKTSFGEFEGDKNGFLREAFIDEEIKSGIDKAEEMTYRLITLANESMRSISDLISLSPLNMEEFSQYAEKGRNISSALVETLYEVDHQQTKALNDVEENLDLLQDYLSEMAISYGDNSSIINFKPLSAFNLPSFKKVRETIYGGESQLDQTDTSILHMMRDPNTYKGVGLGFYDVGKDTVEGIYDLFKDPFGVISDLLLFIGNARFRPVETSLYISKALTDSYIKNVVKGDNESKARWFSYIFGTIGIELIGPKGAGTAVRTSRNMSRMNQLKGTHPLTIESPGVYTNIIGNDRILTIEYQPTAYNVYNTDYILEQLTGKKNSGNSREMVSDKGTGEAGQKVSGANSKVIEELEGPVIDGTRVGSGKKVDEVKPVWGRDEKGKPFIEKEFPHVSKEHGFSDVIDNYSRFAEEFPLVGGDGIKRELFQITGSNNGKKGVFEWIVEPNGDVNHRRFIENGVITGKPNQIPKK